MKGSRFLLQVVLFAVLCEAGDLSSHVIGARDWIYEFREARSTTLFGEWTRKCLNHIHACKVCHKEARAHEHHKEKVIPVHDQDPQILSSTFHSSHSNDPDSPQFYSFVLKSWSEAPPTPPPRFVS